MSEVERTELVTDQLYDLDVQFISDDDKYFPFEARDNSTAVLLLRWMSARSVFRIKRPK